MSRLSLALLVFALLSVQSLAWSNKASDMNLARQCRSLLETSILDFYLPNSIDRKHGGYLEELNSQGEFTCEEKFLTLQARQIWFLSAMANAGIRRDDTLAAARNGYEFLRRHFYDSGNGGYFTKVKRDGTPSDRRKHVYPLSFVIYALVEFARASGEQQPLDSAMELFNALESHCYDRQHGGYHEFFEDDWKPVQDPNAAGYVGAIGTKTYNSHLHLMEAMTPLYLATRDDRVRQRLAELVQIITVSVRFPHHPCNVDAWKPDWSMVDTPQNLRASYGHDVECVWLTLEATKALGRPSGSLSNWARSLADNALEFGFDERHGGFFYTGPIGQSSDDRKKEWWTQAEAMVGMLTMNRLTSDQRYRDAFDRTFSFVAEHQISDRGGWWATVQENGTPSESGSRTSMWHGAYHNGRALLLCERLLSKVPN